MDAISSGPETLENTNQSTITPANREELIILIQNLHRNSKPFHVVSRGQNWGYDAKSLNTHCKVLISLEKMNKILHFDPDLGTLLVEPGVSQGEAAEYLNKLSASQKWCLDVTGANLEASVVGNYLERGFGHTSHGDHELRGKVIEALTVDGKLIAPHQAYCPQSKSRGLYQHDTGLNLEKLFYQTNFAIVTKYLVHLRPKFKDTNYCLILLRREADLPIGLKTLTDLISQGVVNSVPHIANRLRIERAQEISSPVRESWVVTFDISGPPDLVRSRKSIVTKAFKKHRCIFINSSRLIWLKRLSALWPFSRHLTSQIENLHRLLNLLSGIPSSTYVENSLKPTSQNPLQVRWICPLVPNTKSDLEAASRIIGEVSSRYEQELSTTISIINPRCVVWISEIVSEKNSQSALEMAEKCYVELESALFAAGYPFYRYGLNSGSSVFKVSPEAKLTEDIYTKIKATFDEKNLLSRGRWGF